MVDPEVRSYLEMLTDGNEIQSVIVEWPAPDETIITSGKTKSDRQQLLRRHYSQFEKKLAPLATPHLTVKNLPLTGHAIITGSIERLLELVKEGGSLDSDKTIKVHPNVSFYAQSR